MSRRTRRPTRAARRRPPIGLAVVAALLAAAALIWVSANAASPPAASPPQLPPGSATGANALGDPSAPVLVEVWSDFQCPFCRLFAEGAQRQLIETYVASGRVRLVHRHFAFLGRESLWAAQASECAADQGRFWEYHDRLFAEQRGENGGAFAKGALMRYAAELDLDPSFDACLDGDRTLAQVTAERAEGQRLGISSTPTIVVAGQVIRGNVPFAQLQAAVDAALQRAGAP